MAKPDLGNKQKCQNCGTKFFDMNKKPIICPKCGETVEAVVLTATAARASARNANANDDEEEAETETGAEVVSLEDADSTEDGKVETTETDDEAEDDDSNDDDDTFLEEDEDDDSNVSDLIDGDIESDEER